MFPLLEAVPVQVDSHRDEEPMWPIDYTSVGGEQLPSGSPGRTKWTFSAM